MVISVPLKVRWFYYFSPLSLELSNSLVKQAVY